MTSEKHLKLKKREVYLNSIEMFTQILDSVKKSNNLGNLKSDLLKLNFVAIRYHYYKSWSVYYVFICKYALLEKWINEGYD